MRVLVTGHKGYIGSVMVPLLLEAGHQVEGIDSDFYEASTYVDGMVDIPSKKKDIRDVEVADLEGFDAVVHLAALSNDPLGDCNPKLTYEINHEAYRFSLPGLQRRLDVSPVFYSHRHAVLTELQGKRC